LLPTNLLQYIGTPSQALNNCRPYLRLVIIYELGNLPKKFLFD
jgi:hypothetical protein